MGFIKNFTDSLIELANAKRADKSLDDSDFDLNAAAYSEETDHNEKRFYFKGIFLKFSTGEAKTVTLYLVNGSTETILWVSPTNITSQNVVFIPDKDWGFPEGVELKLAITQTTGACSVDALLLTSP